MSAPADPLLLRLAVGCNCPRCGAGTDEPCRTRRLGRETTAHAERVDRAVRLWRAGK